MHDEVVSALKQISTSEPDLFQSKLLVANISRLPENVAPEPQQRKAQLIKVRAYLEELVRISCGTPSQHNSSSVSLDKVTSGSAIRNFQAMELALCQQLKQVLRTPGQTHYANSILAAMVSGLEEFDELHSQSNGALSSEVESSVGLYTNIVLQLFEISVEPKQHSDGTAYTGIANVQDNLDDKFIELVGRFAMIALRSKANTPENNFISTWNAAHPNDPTALWSLFSKNNETLKDSQLHLESGPADKCLANVLSMFLLAGSRPQVSTHFRAKIPNPYGFRDSHIIG